ncbi:MAG: hypothetical protein QM774_09480 [Gordonia sp. (in: high G+C Gram-positive bacteria)]|uniref:hypothetical protein n=1 Tax=Gordonia sp. (in: high G+C Gram-positive bacteria) TaxID=84139 RepID=UPI0039E3A295
MSTALTSARPRPKKYAVGATALVASAAVAGAVAIGPTETQLAATPALAKSTSELLGVALDPEGIVDLVPGGSTLLWPLIKNEVGTTNAIAVLPGVAAAFADKGQSATAFSLLGVAVATTDMKIAGVINIPSGQVACLGALTFANSSTEGACLNVLGLFDAGYNKDRSEVSVALTNPLALLTDGISASKIANTIIDGGSLSQLLTSDFARLTLGGPELIKLTSSYAFQQIAKDPGKLDGGVAIGWLGGKIVLFPVVKDGPLNGSVNYLGLPSVDFSGFPKLDSIGSIIPSIHFGEFTTPIPGVKVGEWGTDSILGSVNASQNVNARVAAPQSAITANVDSGSGASAARSAAPIEAAGPAPAATQEAPAAPAPTLQSTSVPTAPAAPAASAPAAPAPQGAPAPAPEPVAAAPEAPAAPAAGTDTATTSADSAGSVTSTVTE